MTRQQLFDLIQQKRSYLCIGLDPDPARLPNHLLRSSDPIFEFNKQIIDATQDLCVAYKPNLAFYEASGAKGWESLEKTKAYIPEQIFTIADAKRADIGNTSGHYAKAFFDYLGFDAITVAPYMGHDSVGPFLAYQDKWVILLALTSNNGSKDFQLKEIEGSRKLYEEVISTSLNWASPDQLMWVIGATHPHVFAHIRELAPDHFFLVPGVGAQGGDLETISQHGMNSLCGLLVNSSREILYQSQDRDFAKAARKAAKKIQEQMEMYLEKYI